MDCSPLGSSVHEIFQARILEWVAISFSRASSQPRDRTQVSCVAGRRFTVWATRESLCVLPPPCGHIFLPGELVYLSIIPCGWESQSQKIWSRSSRKSPTGSHNIKEDRGTLNQRNKGVCSHSHRLFVEGLDNLYLWNLSPLLILWINFVVFWKLHFRSSQVMLVVKNLPASAGDIRDVGKIPWRRKRQPIPAFLPGKSHGQRSLAGYSPWGHKELDVTEVIYHTSSIFQKWVSVFLILGNKSCLYH